MMFFFILMACGENSTPGNGNQQDLPGIHEPGSWAPCPLDPLPVGEHNTFYLDPINGSNANSGTEAAPLGSLQSVIEDNMIETQNYTDLPYDGSNALVIKNKGALVKAGDTLILLAGYHGEFSMQGAYNSAPITVRAADGQKATLSRIFLSAGANWRFQGLEISTVYAATYTTQTLVQIQSHGWHGPGRKIVVEDCVLYSVEDTSAWTMDDWNTLACNAVGVSGDCITIRNNDCKNVNFGISVSGNFCEISGNTIENFAGDGLRGIGSDLLFSYNTVKNCYDVNANHDDGFQSWSINDDPPRERVVLRGNIIINYEDINQPFRGTLQGIGCFDGFYNDWIIENNLVITDHWHGISLYGAVNCRIVNNTVVDINDVSPGPPWILVNPHKDGTPSRGCVVRNNLAAIITITGDTVEDHNLIVTDPAALFANPADFDFHLRSDATSAIDMGASLLAPSIDLDGVTRPRGNGIDIGCYESFK